MMPVKEDLVAIDKACHTPLATKEDHSFVQGIYPCGLTHDILVVDQFVSKQHDSFPILF